MNVNEQGSAKKGDGRRANDDRPMYQVDAQYTPNSSRDQRSPRREQGWAAAEAFVAAREITLRVQSSPVGDEMSMHRSTSTTMNPSTPPIDADYGIDTVVLVFPVAPDSICLGDEQWKSHRLTNHKSGSSTSAVANTTVNGVGVRVDLYVDDSKVKVELNAARMVGAAPTLLPPAALVPLVEGVLRELGGLFRATFVNVDRDSGAITLAPGWQQEVSIRELHVARNLNVASAKSWFAACEAGAPKYGHLRQINHGKSRSIADRGQKGGTDSLYLKEAGDQGDLYRFESRLKSRRLKQRGLTRLADVSPEACWGALVHRWEASGHGKPFTIPGRAADVLEALKPKDRLLVSGYLRSVEAGMKTGLSASSEARVRKLAESVGIRPGVALTEQGGDRHLVDLYEGREVVAPEPQAPESNPDQAADE